MSAFQNMTGIFGIFHHSCKTGESVSHSSAIMGLERSWKDTTIPFAGLFPPNENQFPLTEIQFPRTEIQFPPTEIQFPPTEIPQRGFMGTIAYNRRTFGQSPNIRSIAGDLPKRIVGLCPLGRA